MWRDVSLGIIVQVVGDVQHGSPRLAQGARFAKSEQRGFCRVRDAAHGGRGSEALQKLLLIVAVVIRMMR